MMLQHSSKGVLKIWNSNSMKILHIITGLDRGGAEAVLFRLVTAAPANTEHTVVSLTEEGVYGPLLIKHGVTVHSLNLPRGRLKLGGLLQLWRLIKTIKPDAIQTWMYHADLVGGVMGRLAGVPAIYWSIHNSTLNRETSSWHTRFTARVCAWVSGWLPANITCCSERAAQVHEALGYRQGKIAVIPYGYDLTQFAPLPEARERLRREWGVPSEMPLLGMAARWDAQKDHANLFSALALLTKTGKDFRCVLAGSGMERTNPELVQLISRAGLEDRVLLLGPRSDVPEVMNALDLHVLSSSYGEAFPNVVAEAMACGTPCAVTDVGDSAMMVDSTGWVAPPRDAAALAERIEEALDMIQTPLREALSQACRQRIMERYGLEKMVATYRDLWAGNRAYGAGSA
jgi:glycosyltransferase involved in cell wall biosynthesis